MPSLEKISCSEKSQRRYQFHLSDGSTFNWSDISLVADVHSVARFLGVDRDTTGKILRKEIKAALDGKSANCFPIRRRAERGAPVAVAQAVPVSTAPSATVVSARPVSTPVVLPARPVSTPVVLPARPVSTPVVLPARQAVAPLRRPEAPAPALAPEPRLRKVSCSCKSVRRYTFHFTDGSTANWSDISLAADVRKLARFLGVHRDTTAKILRKEIKEKLDRTSIDRFSLYEGAFRRGATARRVSFPPQTGQEAAFSKVLNNGKSVRRYTFELTDGSSLMWSEVTLAADVRKLARFLGVHRDTTAKILRKEIKEKLDGVSTRRFPLRRPVRPCRREEDDDDC